MHNPFLHRFFFELVTQSKLQDCCATAMNEGAQNMNAQVAGWYQTYQQDLLLVGYRLGYKREELDDLLHQFFLDLMEKNLDFATVDSPRSYLQTAFKRRLIDYHRSQKRQESRSLLYVVQDHFQPSVQEIIEKIQSDKALIERVRKACNKMPRTCKMVILLKYGEGMTNDQIEQATGLSRRTVYNNLFKGIKILRKELKHIDASLLFMIIPLLLQTYIASA